MIDSYLVKRGDWYYYRRRVPNDILDYDSRKEIKIALKTKHKNTALLRAEIYNNQIEQFWKTLVQTGGRDNTPDKFAAVVKLARAYGFAYKTSDQIAAQPIPEIVSRISPALATAEHAEALLGGAEIPSISLSSCSDEYLKFTIDRLAGKSSHQIKKWENPRIAAINNFVNAVGDKPLREINRSDILAFRNWWRDKIADGMNTDTANKQLRFVRDILQTVSTEYELDIDYSLMFSKMAFRNANNSRPPFEASFVQDKFLTGLHSLNKKDRMVLYALADTGARIAEIFGLVENDICLDADIPFIWIRPREGYKLKTPTSERQIPLVGTALYAFKEYPDGFVSRGNPDSFSSYINKYLRAQKLKPTPQHSIYSLRHTFKDRLRDAEAPEEIIDGLMGHKKSGPKYGRGHKLETKHKWLKKIAYRVPVAS